MTDVKVIETGLVIRDEVFTGKEEVTDVHDIDIAVTKLIGLVINSLEVSAPKGSRNRRIAEFLARPNLTDQIAFAEFETPKRFIRALERRIRKAPANTSLHQREIHGGIAAPFIFVSRDPSIAFAELGYANDRRNAGKKTDDDGNLLASLDMSTLTLTYTVHFVGWDNYDVSKLATHFGMWLRQKDARHVFSYNSVLLDQKMPELSGEIIERHSVTFDNSSAGFEEEKLRALSCILQVNADILRARKSSEVTGKLVAHRGDHLV